MNGPPIHRSAASILRASTRYLTDSKSTHSNSDPKSEDKALQQQEQRPDFRLPFGDWFSNPWSKQDLTPQKSHKVENPSVDSSHQEKQRLQESPFLPKITMVGVSTGDAGQMSKANLKKTMENLTKQLEETDKGNAAGSSDSSDEFEIEDRDPLFVANVGDYYSALAKPGSARWVRGGSS